jgi:hypothetical protein
VASSSSAEESERMYSGVSSVRKIFSGSRSRLKSKKDESRDCNRKSRERDEKKRLLSNGSLLWWEVVLLEWLFPLVHHGLGGFFWKRRTRGREVMEVYANGFAGHQRVYFISSESASGVMTG